MLAGLRVDIWLLSWLLWRGGTDLSHPGSGAQAQRVGQQFFSLGWSPACPAAGWLLPPNMQEA